MSQEEEGPNPIALVHRWRAALDTQMHFNDMLLRTPAAGMSIVIAVFGGAALAVERFPQHVMLFHGLSVHLAAVVMFFGLLLTLSIFVLDASYYGCCSPRWSEPRKSRRRRSGRASRSRST